MSLEYCFFQLNTSRKQLAWAKEYIVPKIKAPPSRLLVYYFKRSFPLFLEHCLFQYITYTSCLCERCKCSRNKGTPLLNFLFTAEVSCLYRLVYCHSIEVGSVNNCCRRIVLIFFVITFCFLAIPFLLWL